jgi:hypothetical protein
MLRDANEAKTPKDAARTRTRIRDLIHKEVEKQVDRMKQKEVQSIEAMMVAIQGFRSQAVGIVPDSCLVLFLFASP